MKLLMVFAFLMIPFSADAASSQEELDKALSCSDGYSVALRCGGSDGSFVNVCTRSDLQGRQRYELHRVLTDQEKIIFEDHGTGLASKKMGEINFTGRLQEILNTKAITQSRFNSYTLREIAGRLPERSDFNDTHKLFIFATDKTVYKTEKMANGRAREIINPSSSVDPLKPIFLECQ